MSMSMKRKDVKQAINESLTEIAKQILIMERGMNIPPENVKTIDDIEYIDVPEDREEKVDEMSEEEIELERAYKEAKRVSDEAEKKYKQLRAKRLIYALSGEEGEGTDKELKDVLDEFNDERNRELSLFIRTKRFMTKVDKSKAYPKYSEILDALIEVLKELSVKKGKKVATLVQLERLIDDKTNYGRTVRNATRINESWIKDAYEHIKEKVIRFFTRFVKSMKRINDKWENALDKLETEFQNEFKNV